METKLVANKSFIFKFYQQEKLITKHTTQRRKRMFPQQQNYKSVLTLSNNPTPCSKVLKNVLNITTSPQNLCEIKLNL